MSNAVTGPRYPRKARFVVRRSSLGMLWWVVDKQPPAGTDPIVKITDYRSQARARAKELNDAWNRERDFTADQQVA